jgi:hypothetical protein
VGRGPAPRGSFSHGTIYGYRVIGCRCADCVAAIATYREKQAAYHREKRRTGAGRFSTEGVVHNPSKETARACRCDSPIGAEECLKCGREIRCSAA